MLFIGLKLKPDITGVRLTGTKTGGVTGRHPGFLEGPSQVTIILQLWDKQWKVRSSCLEKIALGNSRGSSDFPKGRSPEGKSDDPREFLRANLSDNHAGLSTVCQSFGLKQLRI